MRAPGLVVLSRTHWQRMAPASPASRWARTCAHGLAMSMMRLPGRSVSGRDAASRARSIPYRAISSAAFAVSASASGGVTPSASAFANSLRTRSSSALGGSDGMSTLQVVPCLTQKFAFYIELSIELYPHDTTFPAPCRRRVAPTAYSLAGESRRTQAIYTLGCGRSDLTEHPVRGLCPARRRGRRGGQRRRLAARGRHGQPLRAEPHPGPARRGGAAQAHDFAHRLSPDDR